MTGLSKKKGRKTINIETHINAFVENVLIITDVLRSIWPLKKTLEDSKESLNTQLLRQKLLLDSMEEVIINIENLIYYYY